MSDNENSNEVSLYISDCNSEIEDIIPLEEDETDNMNFIEFIAETKILLKEYCNNMALPLCQNLDEKNLIHFLEN